MKRILVIDDDRDVRMCIIGNLEAAGYSVFGADNGNTGIANFRINPVELVIVDLFMPEKEGIETIIELRKDFPDLKILAISGGIPGFGPDHFLHIAQKLGADSSLDKPFTMQHLLSVVEELLSPVNPA
jgi:DNA-binding response OmpR family regulator